MKVSVSDLPIDKISADALVLPVFDGNGKNLADQISVFSNLPKFKLTDFSGKLYETFSIPATDQTPQILFVGMGKKDDFDARIARNVAGVATRRLLKSKIKTLAFDVSAYEQPGLVIEGAGLGEFDPALYKTGKEKAGKLEELIILGKLGTRVVRDTLQIVDAINWTRSLVAEPANRLTPTKVADEAKKIARTYKLDIQVIGEKEAARRGMGAFVGIAQGSNEPSFLISLKYVAGKNYPTLGVVGKGITFDSGGLSIKPADKMHEMKMDMAGAAASLGFMKVVAELKPKVNVVVVAPVTENLPGGGALKPGDVVVAMNGKTIEVLNTDAEGRVVLADGLLHAQKLGATKIVDLATLTGAVGVALGTEASAILGNNQSFIDEVIHAGDEAGERLWQLPIYQEHKEMLKSDIADYANIPPSRGAGVIAGAVFLQEFVENKNQWVHLDIASTAWLDGEKPYMAKGPTGVGIRTLLALLKNFN